LTRKHSIHGRRTRFGDEMCSKKVLPDGVRLIMNWLDLRPHDIMVDLGSGAGDVVMQICSEILCVTIAEELVTENHHLAMSAWSRVSEKWMSEKGGSRGKMSFVQMDMVALLEAFVRGEAVYGAVFPMPTKVWFANKLLPDHINDAVFLLLEKCPTVQAVACMKPWFTPRKASNYEGTPRDWK